MKLMVLSLSTWRFTMSSMNSNGKKPALNTAFLKISIFWSFGLRITNYNTRLLLALRNLAKSMSACTTLTWITFVGGCWKWGISLQLWEWKCSEHTVPHLQPASIFNQLKYMTHLLKIKQFLPFKIHHLLKLWWKIDQGSKRHFLAITDQKRLIWHVYLQTKYCPFGTIIVQQFLAAQTYCRI